jgi:SAM-dependent methyltransferase
MTDGEAAMAAVLDAIQDSLRDRIAGGIGPLEGRPESWGFVGGHTAEVVEQLLLARRSTSARRPRFLECGSGFGFVAALAKELGFAVTGVEVEPSYVELSRRIFPAVPVEEADLRTYDRFAEFDVVYYYAPFADDETQARFERRVEAALLPGAILVANRKLTHEWRDTFDLLSPGETNGWVLRKKAP